MKWIDKCSQADECATIGNCKISRLLFADDLVLLSSRESDLQRALNSFAEACDTAGMKIRTAKTEVLHLLRNSDQCVLQVNGATLKQVVKFKLLKLHLRVTEGKTKTWIPELVRLVQECKLCANRLSWNQSCQKRQSCQFLKQFLSPFSPMVHESWLMTEIVRSQVQASEMRSLRRIKGVTPFNKVRSYEIRNLLTSSRYFFSSWKNSA